jgi:uncharacterized protein (TIGR02453 family)
MIQPETLLFLDRLKKNNNRDWFEKHRNEYETTRADFADFTAGLIKELGKINGTLKGLQAKDCIFRIYRDVRFSKNKDPYKINFGAYVAAGGRKSTGAGFYIQVQPGSNSFAGGGCWQPESIQLKAIRQEIQYHTEEFKKITGSKLFIKYFKDLSGDRIKTVPRGFSKDDPDKGLYMYTSYIVEHSYTDKEVIGKNFVAMNAEMYKAIFPFLCFLNRATGA